ncbi:hypothetical protein PGN35_007995 [Nodosilinea sp. PGN35]|uniref:Pepco domain-containing protein n=1 Tax=Nodosilinea sp. PGN35 TaxID=3020489 RepID=UPI00398B8FC4
MPDSLTPPNEIILLVSPDEVTPIEGQRGWGETIQKQAAAMVEVRLDPTVLERQMAGFLGMVGRLFQQADQQIQAQLALPPGTPPSVQLSEIELSVEIGAKGEVKLVAGGEASGKGAIKLKFTRPGEK